MQTHPLRSPDPRAESAHVVEILRAELARDPEQSIAVLVRSRSHLAGLRERLRTEGWPVHAVEIDALGEQSIAQDLLGLTRALLASRRPHRVARGATRAMVRPSLG